MRKLFAATAVLAVLTCAGVVAQQAKPWELQGTNAGQEVVGPDGGTMVWVPPGEFTMGSGDGEGRPNERPAHRVRITKGFWLSKCEVSLAQWKRYCQAAGIAVREDLARHEDDHPLWGADWDDCWAYSRFYGLSLPTEAQWEYAARGPEGRRYPWGNEWDASRCCNDDNVGPKAATFPVGSFPAGAAWCGALDMAGNLAAWCNDWYSATYYAVSPAEDPKGPDQGTERVQRGGYFWSKEDECRGAWRSSDDPKNRDGAGGLRTCFTP
jgi:iron(II)-dependent oxidoreductase